MKNSNREFAISHNLLTYTHSCSCKHGHPPIRYTKTNKCTTCAKIAYTKSYQETKDDYRRRYLDNKERVLKQTRLWKKRNSEYVKKKNREYYKKNKKRVLQYHKQHYQDIKSKFQTPEFKKHRSRIRKTYYRKYKQKCLENICNYYKSINMEVPANPNEQSFENYVAWMMIQRFDVIVASQHVCGDSLRKVDLYLPQYNIGIEVKLDIYNWTQKKVMTQVTTYKQLLNTDHVFVVSPKGRFQYTIETLLEKLESLITT